ncbi:MAG: arsenite methyltransferase [Phycisphaerales bacterium]
MPDTTSASSAPTKSAPCCGPGCCTPSKADPASNAPTTATPPVGEQDQVRRAVREGYTAIARAGSWTAAQSQAAGATATAAATSQASAPAPTSCCGGSPGASNASGGCCGPSTMTGEQLAAALGYEQTDLAATPDGANMGLGCGNPTAIAALKPGEVVLDLGSGGGFDCFIAGRRVGPTGRVIGVDMTPDMLSEARKNVGVYRERTGLDNVEFRLGEIEALPVADASVDVVMSNCVLNLSPDKARVWREIARVLKPGGRVAVSDLALLKPLPDAVRRDIEALVGCVAGAVLVDETRRQMEAAGLRDLALTSKPEYIDAMTSWEDPLYRRIIAALPAGSKTSDYITSLDIVARKA